MATIECRTIKDLQRRLDRVGDITELGPIFVMEFTNELFERERLIKKLRDLKNEANRLRMRSKVSFTHQHTGIKTNQNREKMRALKYEISRNANILKK